MEKNKVDNHNINPIRFEFSQLYKKKVLDFVNLMSYIHV